MVAWRHEVEHSGSYITTWKADVDEAEGRVRSVVGRFHEFLQYGIKREEMVQEKGRNETVPTYRCLWSRPGCNIFMGNLCPLSRVDPLTNH